MPLNLNSHFSAVPKYLRTACLSFILSFAVGCSAATADHAITQLAMTPDGAEFVFRHEGADGKSAQVRYDKRSGDISYMSVPANEFWYSPSFSADGQWMAMSVAPMVDGQPRMERSYIDVMRTDQSGRRTVVGPNDLIKTYHTFSPDAHRLLYAEGRPWRTGKPTSLNVREVSLDTLDVSEILMAGFYNLNSLSYFGDRFAFVGYAPSSYLERRVTQPPASDADAVDGVKFEMQTNTMLYVTGPKPKAIAPYIEFPAGPTAPQRWAQRQEVERVRVAQKSNRVFVVLRHTQYPAGQSPGHFVRDIFEMLPDRTLRRLTYFNTVQFFGFDVTPDGRYIAAVPDVADQKRGATACIVVIDTSDASSTCHAPDFSRLLKAN